MITLQNILELRPTALDGIDLPEDLDKTLMKSIIMMRLGLCWPVYDEPFVFESMVNSWFAAHKWNINRLVKVTNIDYSPLENYDRFEDFTDSGTGGETVTDTNIQTHNRTDTMDRDTSGEGTTESSAERTNTNTVSAYNEDDFQNDNKSDGEESSNQTVNNSETVEESRHYGGTITDKRDTSRQNSTKNNRSGRAHGNIGVTTSQQMFVNEISLLNGYNIYYTICNWLERDLFIQVY